ncbi:hypothetical protein F4808DRAFT_462375 [Astrocystis sublimbata]|nr:hypothetical protein F4808DRAFT_462375 [Astrocystis sublimbata]
MDSQRPQMSTSSTSLKGRTFQSQEAQLALRLSIIVFTGDPVDAPQFRHTGLLIHTLSTSTSTSGSVILQERYLQVQGSAGFFARDESVDADPAPASSELFAGLVPVATIPVPATVKHKNGILADMRSRLRKTIWDTPVNNSENAWNCQSWVGDALYGCVRKGLVGREEVERAIDGMVDLILLARDVV